MEWEKGLSSGQWNDFYGATLGPLQTVGKNASSPMPAKAETVPDWMFTPDEINKVVDDVKAGGSGFEGLDIGSLIGRGAIIILGFIFVAAGLAMFRPGMTVENFTTGVAKGAAIA